MVAANARRLIGGAAVCAVAALLLLLAPVARADVYMHNPRGSNDRNCERNVNRNNGNRMFDSQNNAKGGYACPRAVGGPDVITEKMYYYAGSKLPVEWTAQHGCGTNPKEHCEIVLQYACEDTFDPDLFYRRGANVGTPRDGIPRGPDDAATDTIPDDPAAAIPDETETRRFGMHENHAYYQDCKHRERNKGLFTADQRLNRNDARATRQNPNGNRNGYECPEERDYYPYWHPTPWRDIAVLTSHEDRCTYFQAESQNVVARGQCVPPEGDGGATTLANQGRWYNNKFACEDAGYTWQEFRFGNAKFAGETEDPPHCELGKFGRINHLGNAEGTSYTPEGVDDGDAVAIPHNNNANRFVWTVPDHPNENCVLRLRYNISTADYDAWDIDGSPGLNATFNGKGNSPIEQDPYVQIGDDEDEFVSLALNTNQYGRTFQDRSYVFEIKEDPRSAAQKAAGVQVYNLNVRGKRGNIVQTYPAVEYDFVPNDLNIKQNDMIHFQWTGSDYNPRRGCNNGEGGPPDPNTALAARDNSRADRSNIIEMTSMDENIPRDITSAAALAGATMFVDANGAPDMDTVMELAFLNQKEDLAARGRRCLTQEELEDISNKNERENHPQNCAKINAAFTPYFDAGLKTMRAQGAFTYFSSRNNNFSNRDQTGRICVRDPNGNANSACGPLDSSGARGVQNIGYNVISDRLVDNTGQVLTEETFAFNEKDNDSFGDGERDDCEEMRWEMPGVSAGGAVAIAFVCFGVGIAATIGTQYGMQRYREKHGIKPGEPLNCFKRGDATPHQRLNSTKKAPPPPPSRDAAPSSRRAPPPPPPR